MQKKYSIPLECFGIHVHMPHCEVGENEHVFIGALNAQSIDDLILDDVLKTIEKHVPDHGGEIKKIQFKELDKGEHKRLFFFDGFLLDEKNYPIASEKKQKIYASVVRPAA